MERAARWTQRRSKLSAESSRRLASVQVGQWISRASIILTAFVVETKRRCEPGEVPNYFRVVGPV